jgi:hypothetical protein
MRLTNSIPIYLGVAMGALIPIGTLAAGDTLAALNVSPVVGKEAVYISGTAAAALQLQAVLYAKVSQDLPTVLLSRRPLTTDADGKFSATLPIAPAYFRGSIITVVVQSQSAVPIARGSVTIGAPNVPAPADQLPTDYR